MNIHWELKNKGGYLYTKVLDGKLSIKNTSRYCRLTYFTNGLNMIIT